SPVLAAGAELNELEPARHDPLPAAAVRSAVGDRMLQVHQHARLRARIVVIDQDCTLFEQRAVPPLDRPHNRAAQRVSRRDQVRGRLPGHAELWLVEANTLVAGQYVTGAAALPGAVAQLASHMRDLVAPGFSFADPAAQQAERLKEKRAHVVWLQLAGLRFFQIRPDPGDVGLV